MLNSSFDHASLVLKYQYLLVFDTFHSQFSIFFIINCKFVNVSFPDNFGISTVNCVFESNMFAARSFVFASAFTVFTF